MNILKLIAQELLGMFVDDEFLALAVLAVVAIAAWIAPSPAVAGAFLLVGCIAVLIASVLMGSRKRRR